MTTAAAAITARTTGSREAERPAEPLMPAFFRVGRSLHLFFPLGEKLRRVGDDLLVVRLREGVSLAELGERARLRRRGLRMSGDRRAGDIDDGLPLGRAGEIAEKSRRVRM